MGILRSIGKGIGGFILTTSLAFLILSIGLAQITEYENMKNIFTEILSGQIGPLSEQTGSGGDATRGAEGTREEDVEKLYQTILQMCEGKESIQVSISESGDLITINCDDIRAAEQSIESGSASVSNVIGNVTARAIFDNIYYKTYDCELLNCVQTGQFSVVLSAQGHEFFKSVQTHLAVATIVGAFIIFIAAECWSDRLKGLGWPLVFIGLSYFFLSLAKSAIISQFPIAEQAGVNVMSIVDRVLAPIMNNFLILFIVGVTLTACGYGLAYKERKRERKEK